jgi:hypothetical protein
MTLRVRTPWGTHCIGAVRCALSVRALLQRLVQFPVPLRFTDSVVFARFDLGGDHERARQPQDSLDDGGRDCI